MRIFCKVKSYRERQVPYDLTCMWNLKITKIKLIEKEITCVVTGGGEMGGHGIGKREPKVQTAGH